MQRNASKEIEGGEVKKAFGALIGLAALAALGVSIARGIQDRLRAESKLELDTRDAAITTVSVVRPKAGAAADELLLPGTIEAFTDTPVYARTDGYLKRWFVDIGAHVTTGQLLAEIETPETDQQLSQARAQLATTRATHDLAVSTAARWQALLKTDSVSRQETDEKTGDLAAKKAAVDAADANVKRLEKLQAFQKIFAPFNGVITARNTDIGALINAGSNGPGRELYHLAAIGKVRVYVQVPQANSRAAKPGAQVELTLQEYPGRVFHARVARTTNAIDPASRTLRVEVDVDNPDGALLPGAYVEVHLKLPQAGNALTIPFNATLFRAEGMSVAAVRDGRVELLPVTVGHDYGNSLEIVAGLRGDEQLIVNPPDSIGAGQRVRVSEARQ
ncbi:MAG: efflux RND transporter periplasmic adaptor subunit [Acidobacteria bacterium]|nr:efflux RND transporter periplasmic adaptor subunit [Acidobacteriota bacterium]